MTGALRSSPEPGLPNRTTCDRSLVIVGIGPGNPGMVTTEALAALAELDVVIGFDKGERTAELAAVRRAVLDRARRGRPCRMIQLEDRRRDATVGYRDAVDIWHRERTAALEQALLEDVADGEQVGILVWGDPSLYDSTLRLVDALRARNRVRLAVEVIPGVSSLSLLAARHGVPLHDVGGSLLVTTGRRLRAGVPFGIDAVAVLLDGECSFTRLSGQGWRIWWGAYLGMRDEHLLAGPLDAVAARIVELRRELRDRHGWIFDLYLLRR